MSNKFKEIRKAMGLNQKDFAAKLGIKQSYYSSIEQGKKEPSIKILDALWYLGVSFDWYYNGKGEMFVDTLNVGNNGEINISDSNNSMYTKIVEGMSFNKCTLIENNSDFLTKYYYGAPLLPHHYEYIQIKYYDSLSAKRVKELLDLEKDEYEEAYNQNVSLTSFLHYFNPPKFLKEKFALLKPFPEHFKDIVEEFEENTPELSNEKLKDILLILKMKEYTQGAYSMLGKLIDYMSRYKSLIYKYVRSNIIADFKGRCYKDEDTSFPDDL